MANKRVKSLAKLAHENLELRAKLEESEEALRAIREGDVDAIVISGKTGERVFSLCGSDRVYRLIVETMQEAALNVTLDGQILYCNAQFSELIQTPMPRIIGRRLEDFVSPHERESVHSLIETSATKSMRGRLVFQGERGVPVPVYVSANVLHQQDATSISIVASDLTEVEASTEMVQQLRQQQEALGQSEQRYRDLVELSPEAILVQCEGVIVYINRAGERLFGAHGCDILGTDLIRRIAGDYRGAVTDKIRSALERGDYTAQAEVKALRVDGGFVEVEFTVGRIMYHGRPAVQVILRDIRARKASQRERDRLLTSLDRQKSFLRSALNQMPAGIMIAEAPSGRLVMSNDQMIKMCGPVSIGEHYSVNKAFDCEGQPHDDRQRAIGRALAGEIVADQEMRFLRPDGSWTETLANAAPIHDSAGRIVAAVVVHVDIAERKRMEAELRKAQEELETKVDERTSELTQAVAELQEEISLRISAEQILRERTYQLRALASELTIVEQKERRRMAEVIHDHLQQYLVGAKFRLGALRLSPEKDVNQAIAEVDEMIGQSIDVARSLTGELSPPMLHEGGLVPALLWLVRWMKEKHRLAVELVAPERVTTETEDTRVLLFQAVRELLLNVVKHAKTHSAHVEVQRAEDQLQVTVWDEGIGFDPAQLKAGRGGNSGFGLFSIRERIELSGGTIKIDSAVGSGSRFTLCAPIERTVPAKDPAANEVKIRILLVDDHVTVRQGLAHLLESETDIMVIGEASDGRSSLELVQTLRPHVVIMDVKMPGMNGIEATRLIKSEFPETEIIGLSMFEDDEHTDAMRNAGASVYLSKIGPSEKLFAAIRACGLKVAAGHALLEKKAVQ